MRKSKSPTKISLSASFEKKAGDGTFCYLCKEPIFGNLYNLVLNIAGKTETLNVSLCESCHELDTSELAL